MNSNGMISILSSLSDEISSLIASLLPSTVTIYGDNRSLTSSGSGSGWIYDHLGHIVTNAHVVKDLASPLKVKPAGKPQGNGTVIGIDESTDLAVVKLEVPQASPPIRIRTSQPRLGEFCIALGSPLSLRESASIGIVSGLSRQSRHPDGQIIEEMLQTDASVNPGNSGGPLIDAQGLLLGVNTLGIGETVNFAVPADTVLSIIPELIEFGSVQRGSIGISIAASWLEIDSELREMVQVRSVVSDHSPLKPGDYFLVINSTPIKKRADVQKMLNRQSIGRKIEIELLRDGKVCKECVVPEVKTK